jgi:hypothetical protein
VPLLFVQLVAQPFAQLVAQLPTPSDSAPVPVLPPFVPPTPEQATAFLGTLILTAGLAVALYALLFVVLRSVFRRTDFELGIAILTPSSHDRYSGKCDAVYYSILHRQHQAGTLVSRQSGDE